MNLRLDGKIAAAAIKEELKEKFASLPNKVFSCRVFISSTDNSFEFFK